MTGKPRLGRDDGGDTGPAFGDVETAGSLNGFRSSGKAVRDGGAHHSAVDSSNA
jgi:hypothetical protein